MPSFSANIKNFYSRGARTGAETPEQDNQETSSLGLVTLHEATSTRPVADIVFIHGLGGDGRKTWSNSSIPGSFWPQDWLPAEDGFHDVRIHSFGYRADWGKRQQSILNIHDFAESLVCGLKNHPGIRQDGTGIILIGHSMGGCVAKEAYIVARQHPAYQALSRRIHGIFFLSTPHHGSNLAGTLDNMLRVAWGRKSFVADLKSGSSALAIIRDGFRHVAADLALWTFFETLPSTIGLTSSIVVDKDSAILGFHNERIMAINADHRHVCKFSSRQDPNYRILRNALLTAVDEIREKGSESAFSRFDLETNTLASVEGHLRLKSILGIRDTPGDDLAMQSELRMPDSCKWFTNSPGFTCWKAENDAPSILWLTGRPGTGKSILSSHVISQLRMSNVYCSYFFCKHSTTSRSSLGECFRSLAYQMAIQDHLVREKLADFEHETAWDRTDDTTTWTKLFANRIFNVTFERQHFWVIDGLDECANFDALFTHQFLARLPRHRRLRVFVTSRDLDTIERGIASLGPQATVHALLHSDTFDDIRRLLFTKLRALNRLGTEDQLEAMCNKMLEMSSGSFLWAHLILQEFERAWTKEAMELTLKQVPAQLCDLYGGMVQSIEADYGRKALAKTVLTWVALACRPLSLDELRCAVKLELKQTLSNRRAIPSLCGQLVYIDTMDKVHLVHETAREFLLSRHSDSEFIIEREQGHSRIASTLTRYLADDGFKGLQSKPSRATRPMGVPKSAVAEPPESSLLDYASTFFSNHVYHSSVDDDLMDHLSLFLNKNALSWIEHLAANGELSNVTRTALNLRRYLGRRAKHGQPDHPSHGVLEGWVTDLVRVASKFQPQLLACPRSIHSLIPPLCPSDSMVFQTYARRARSASLDVRGLPAGGWDDCLSRINFQKGQATAVSHGNGLFAVGLSTGTVFLYDSGSVHLLLTIEHPEGVTFLDFSQDDKYLATCGARFLILWEPKSGTKMCTFPLPSIPLGIAFQAVDDILTLDALSDSRSDGSKHTPLAEYNVSQQLPASVAFLTNGDGVLLALGYRNHPVIIWDMLEERVVGRCVLDANNGIDDMVFNPNPETTALVVSCNDGRLCLFDYLTMALASTLPEVFAQTIACSPDGHSLVAGASHGVVSIFSFGHDDGGSITLALVHRIDAQGSIRRLTCPSGLRFLDVHGQQCRVWEPTALVRTHGELGNAATSPVRGVETLNTLEETGITSPMVMSKDGRWVVAGKRSDVCLFSTADASEAVVLYQHTQGVSVIAVAVGEQSNVVVSADDSGRILIGELTVPLRDMATKPPGQKAPAARVSMNRRFDGAVLRLLINDAADRLLVTSHDADELWELPSGRTLARKQHSHAQPAASCTRTAVHHPSNAGWIVVMAGDVARVYDWKDYAELTPEDGIRLQRSEEPTPQSHGTSKTSYHVGPGVIVECVRSLSNSSPRIYTWPAAALDPHSTAVPALAAAEPSLDAVSPVIRSVIGLLGPSTLVFLDTDLWVCSIELGSASSGKLGALGGIQPSPRDVKPRRHFFALSEWCDEEGELKCAVASGNSGSRDVVFARSAGLVVVKGGFDFSETMGAV